MNKIVLFFNMISIHVATTRLAKLVTLAQFDQQGIHLDLANGDIDVAYHILVRSHEPKMLVHRSLEVQS